MIQWQIERQQTTGLRTKSLFVLLWDDETGEHRLFEVIYAPLEADAETYVAQNFDPGWMWQAGLPIPDDGLDVALVRAKAAEILDDLDGDLLALPDATAVDVKEIIGRGLLRQRQIVRVIASLLAKGGG